MCRGPFDFAQGRLFDYVAASLREAATPLRMTIYKWMTNHKSALEKSGTGAADCRPC
jgi:hypothetical protein